MDRLCILRNTDKDPDSVFTNDLARYLSEKGAQVKVVTDARKTPRDAQALIVLGGDGTMLRAARRLYAKNIPMIGINLGSVGYLTELSRDDAPDKLDALLTDDFTIEERMMLTGKLIRNGCVKKESVALNDIVISRRGPLRVMMFENYVNGRRLNAYNADGIVAASPTGSTGYAFSVGGPIVSPRASLMILTPIAAHTVGQFSVILPSTDTIQIRIGPDRISQPKSAAVYYDGEEETVLEAGDYIEVTRAQENAKLIRLGQQSFLDVLRQKLQMQ